MGKKALYALAPMAIFESSDGWRESKNVDADRIGQGCEFGVHDHTPVNWQQIGVRSDTTEKSTQMLEY